MVVFSSSSSSSPSSSSSFVVMSFQGPACPNILQTTPQTLLHQPDDRTGEKLMVEVRAKNQNKVKAKKRRDHQFLGYIFDDPAILFPKQIVSSTIFPTPALLPSKHVIDPQIA